MTLGNYRFQLETANGDNKGLAVPRHCYPVGTEIQCIYEIFKCLRSSGWMSWTAAQLENFFLGGGLIGLFHRVKFVCAVRKVVRFFPKL